MAATIKIKNSSTTGAVPTSGDLVQGELAVNVTDLGLYTENASGTVVKLNAPSIDDKNTGATKHLTISTGGNLGLGVTPSAWSGATGLQVKNASMYGTGNLQGFAANSYLADAGANDRYIATGTAVKYLGNISGDHRWYVAPSGTAGNAITFTQAMTLDASGNLGVGTTSPSFPLDVVSNSAANAFKIRARSGNDYGFMQFSSNDGATRWAEIFGIPSGLVFTTGSSGTERARIDSSGNLLVGTTSVFGAGGISIQPSAGAPTVDVKGSATTNGSSVFNVYSTGASAYRFYVGMGGTISATSTTITGISDRRLKENIRDLDDGLEKVMALQPRKFDWKEGKGADVKNARGFIAQEFEQVFPDLIEQWKDEPPEGEEPYKAVRADLIPTLVKAIQEQQAIITDLTNRITALEGAK